MREGAHHNAVSSCYSEEELGIRRSWIRQRGLPVTLTFRRRGDWWLLHLEPMPGFVHLTPPPTTAQYFAEGWTYHISVASRRIMRQKRSRYPLPVKRRISRTLTTLRSLFHRPVVATLMVERFGSDGTVALLHPLNPLFRTQNLWNNILFTRKAVGLHYSNNLTVSL